MYKHVHQLPAPSSERPVFQTPSSRLPALNSQLPAHSSQLPTSNSQPPAPSA